jgi:uncharacterized membrane protein YhaH (DUF805 family)
MSMSAEMLSQPPPSSAADVEPGRIKVFGIIHIIFGALGVMNMVGGIVWLVFQEQIMGFSNAGEPEELIAAQEKMYRDLAPTSWISIVISLIVSVLILRAGIALVKRRQSSVKLSNTYALASLVAKAVGALLFFVMVMPVVSGALDTMLGESIPAPDVKAVLAFIKGFMVLAGVLGPLMGAIYPLCSILMLNKPQVKEFLERNGT